MKLVIIKNKCFSCGKCLAECPMHCIDIIKKEIDTKKCNSCGACINTCCYKAIEIVKE